MGQFDGILWKRKIKRSVSAVLASIVLCGCQSTIEQIRPEINSDQTFVGDIGAIPEVIAPMQSESNSQGDIIMGGTAAPEYSTTPAGYPETRQEYIEASAYNKYLKLGVYEVLWDIMSGSGVNMDNLYFHVLHTGYNNVENEPWRIEQASALDYTHPGKIDSVGGHILGEYIVKWLSPLAENSAAVEERRAGYLSTLEPLSSSTTPTTLENQSELSGMWRNERLGNPSLEQFKQIVKSNVVGAVANINLSIKVGANVTSTIRLNPYEPSEYAYVDHILANDLRVIFTPYNQYETREQTSMKGFSWDEHSILCQYTDGYNRTLVYLAVAPSTSENPLQDVLGDSYDDVFNFMKNDFIYCNQPGRLSEWILTKKSEAEGNASSFEFEYDTIALGSRGVN